MGSKKTTFHKFSLLRFLGSLKVYKFGLCSGIFEQSMGARNRIGIGLSYRPARLHRLAGRYDNAVPTRFLAPIDCSKIRAQIWNFFPFLQKARDFFLVPKRPENLSFPLSAVPFWLEERRIFLEVTDLIPFPSIGQDVHSFPSRMREYSSFCTFSLAYMSNLNLEDKILHFLTVR